MGEAAVEQRFWGGGAAVLTLRHSRLRDVVDVAPVFQDGQAFDQPANIGSGSKDELITSFTLPLGRFGLKGGELRGQSTWRRSAVVDPGTGRKREISALRPVEWEAHFTHDLPRRRVNWGVDVSSGWRETYYRTDNIELRKLKTYVTPFYEWKPRPDLSLRFESGNFTERGFRNTRYLYDGPRSLGRLERVDDRDIQFGRMVYVRVRKTLGG